MACRSGSSGSNALLQENQSDDSLHCDGQMQEPCLLISPTQLQRTRASSVAQLLKNPPAVQETWVRSLRLEDPLEKEMATHSSTLAWRIPQTEEPGRLQSMGLQRVRDD